MTAALLSGFLAIPAALALSTFLPPAIAAGGTVALVLAACLSGPLWAWFPRSRRLLENEPWAGPVAALATAAISVLACLAARTGHRDRFAAFVRELRAEGRPVSFEDLRARRNAPADARLVAVLQGWEGVVGERGPLPHPSAPLPARAGRGLNGPGSRERRAMAELGEALRRPSASPTRSYELPPKGAVFAGRALASAALGYALSGDAIGAWDAVRLHGMLADSWARIHGMGTAMGTLSLRQQAAESASRVVRLLPGSGMPPDIHDRLASWPRDNLLSQGIEQFLAVVIVMRDNEEKGSGPTLGLPGYDSWEGAAYGIARPILVHTGAMDLDALTQARWLRSWLSVSSWAEVPARASEEERLRRLPHWPYRNSAGMAERFQFRLAMQAEWRSRAWTRLALAGAAVQAGRRSTGRFPALLQEAPRGLRDASDIEDPFSGGLFRYERSGPGAARLCSAGPAGDGRDTNDEPFCLPL